MRRLTLALSGLFALLLVSGCGIRGDLERPPPVWGPDERTPAEREHETADDTKAGDARFGGAAGLPR